MAVGVNLQVETVPWRGCVQVQQAIRVPPVGAEQRGGVWKSSDSLPAAQCQQHELQEATLRGLGHGVLSLVAEAGP